MKNTTKTFAASLLTGAAFLIVASGAFAAQEGNIRTTVRQQIRQEANIELRNNLTATGQAIRNEIKNQVREEVQTMQKNIIDKAKDLVKRLLPRRIHGTIAAIAADKTSLTVTTDSKTVTVYISANTLLKRRFGGNSTIGEFQTGDEVAVIGSVRALSSSSSSGAADTNTIDARYIRDLSIQKRNTVFVGRITAMTADGFKVQTQSRGLQTVHVNSSTVYQEKNAAITLSDLHEGDRVLVKGSIWNRAESDIDAAKVLKLPTVPASGSSSTAPASSSSSSSSVSSQAGSSSVI